MKRRWICLVAGLLFIVTFLTGTAQAYARSEHGFTGDSTAYVDDNAGAFSKSEREELTKWIMEKEAESGISIRIVTDKMSMAYEKTYLEDTFDYLFDDEGTVAEDAVFMLLNLDPEERGVCLQGYGECEFYFNNDRIEHVLDDMMPYLKKGKYASAAKLFVTEAAYYRKEEQGVSHNYLPGQEYGESYGGPSNYYKDNSLEHIMLVFPWGLWFFGAAGFAAVAVWIMVSNSGGKMTATGRDYMNKEKSAITARKDEFLRESVTKVYSPQSSGSSGSGGRSSHGGGRSSGGHSHSGGSRRF